MVLAKQYRYFFMFLIVNVSLQIISFTAIAQENSREQLLKDLDSPIVSVRQYAIDSLAKMSNGSDFISDQIYKCLKDNSDKVKSTAAMAIRRLNHDTTTDKLLLTLNDKDPLARVGALEILIYTKDKRIDIEEVCLKALKDGNGQVRFSAVSGLIKHGSAKALAPLIASFKDDHRFLAQMASDSVVRIGGEKAVMQLIDALRDDNANCRRFASYTLGRIGNTEAVMPLISLIDDSDTGVRASAAEALEKLKDKRAVNPLIKLLKDENYVVRESAVNALSSFKDKKAVPDLKPLLSDKAPQVRGAAERAIQNITGSAIEERRKYSEKEMREYEQQYEQSLRASFKVAGSVKDEAGNPLNAVALKLVISRFTPRLTGTNNEFKYMTLDSTFKIKQKDAFALDLIFSKEGYYPETLKISYMDITKKMQEERYAKMRKGIKTPEPTWNDLKNLSYTNKEVTIMLKKIQGNLAVIVDAGFQEITPKNAESESVFKIYSKDQSFTALNGFLRFKLKLDSKAKEGISNAYLETPKGGGIIVVSPVIEFKDMKEAPLEGYKESIDILPFMHRGECSFYIKSPDGKYMKMVGQVVIGMQNSTGYLWSLSRCAIQLDGTRNLGTIEEVRY